MTSCHCVVVLGLVLLLTAADAQCTLPSVLTGLSVGNSTACVGGGTLANGESCAVRCPSGSSVAANANNDTYSCSAGVLSEATLQCTPSTPDAVFAFSSTGKAQFSCTIGGGTLSWSVEGTTLVLAYKSTATGNTWFGIGPTTSGNMLSSYPWIYINGASPPVEEYSITGRSTSSINAVGASPLIYSGRTTDGALYIVRPLAAASVSISATGETAMIWAVGDGATFAEHSRANRGISDVNFATGKCDERTTDLEAAHGALMAVGWGILIPIGVFVARYGKSWQNAVWFKLHVGFQLLGALLFTIGFFIAIKFTDDLNKEHFHGGHGKYGLAVVVLGWFQVFNGALRAGKDASWRPAWYWLHALLGRLLLVLAVITILGGMSLYGSPDSVQMVFIIWVALYVAVSVFAEVQLCRKKGQKTESDADGGTELR